jgi:arabinofuranosyltransferase
MPAAEWLRKNWMYVALGLVVAGWLAYSWFTHYILEDAYISFRYSRNLVRGEGLVFNPGERAEGYTNFLWVLSVAAGTALGLEPETTAVILGLLAGALVILLVWSILNRLTRGKPHLPLLGAVLTALYFPLSYHSGSGLETAAFSALLLAAVNSYLRPPPRRFPWTGLWLGLLALTRAEGLAYTLFFAAHHVWMRRRKTETGADWRDLIPALGLPLAQLVFRLLYYGLLLPLPAIVKAGWSWAHILGGARFVFDWMWGTPTILLAFLALYGIVRRWKRPESGLFLLLLAAVVGFTVYTGGDMMGYYRFLLPAYLFLVVLAVVGVDELFDLVAPRRLFPGLLSAFLALWTVACFALAAATRVRHPRELLTPASSGWLHDNVPPETLLASGGAGRLAYLTDLPFVDLHGLCTAEVALHGERADELRPGHEVGDAEAVFRRKPGLIVIRPLPGTLDRIEDWVAGRRATTDYTWAELTFAQQLVLSDPRMADYQALVVDVSDRIEGGPPGGESYYLGFYARRGALSDLLVFRGAVPVEPARPEGFFDPRGERPAE